MVLGVEVVALAAPLACSGIPAAVVMMITNAFLIIKDIVWLLSL